MTESDYTPACVLRRCGQIEGCEDARLPVFDTDADGNIIEMDIDGRRLMLNAIWDEISQDKCAQFMNGCCLSRYTCHTEQHFCYPIPVAGKRPNRIVAVMFAWYCVDSAEKSAYAAGAAAAAAYAADAADVALAADAAFAAAAAAYTARVTARAAHMVNAVEHGADAAEDDFYFNAARELEKLIAAWGTPIKGGDD